MICEHSGCGTYFFPQRRLESSKKAFRSVIMIVEYTFLLMQLKTHIESAQDCEHCGTDFAFLAT